MALPVEVLFGLFLGLLTGILPALVAGTLGFTFRYFTGVTVPGFAVVVLGLAIAGINGGFLGLLDERGRRSRSAGTARWPVGPSGRSGPPRSPSDRATGWAPSPRASGR